MVKYEYDIYHSKHVIVFIFSIGSTTFPVSTLISSENLTLSLMQDIAETSSFLYKWLFFGTIVLCVLLGSCVVVLLVKLVLKKRANTDMYQYALPSTTDGILHVYESCETDLHLTMENTDNTLNQNSRRIERSAENDNTLNQSPGHIQRSAENIYLTVIDTAGT